MMALIDCDERSQLEKWLILVKKTLLASKVTISFTLFHRKKIPIEILSSAGLGNHFDVSIPQYQMTAATCAQCFTCIEKAERVGLSTFPASQHDLCFFMNIYIYIYIYIYNTKAFRFIFRWP
jgi:hypothetical protein